MTVKSSMDTLIGCWQDPGLDMGPVHATSADIMNIFITSANRGTDIVQPLMMPFSSQYHSDDKVQEDTLRLKSIL